VNRPNLLQGQNLPPPPQQRRSREKRQAILEAAIVRFGRDGYERASIEGIAREAGVATGAVYQFFRSKRQLLLVLMDALLQRLEDLPPPKLAVNRPILKGIEGFLTDAFSREIAFVGVYRAWQEAALVDAAFVTHDQQIRAWSYQRVRGLLGLLVNLPSARHKLDLATLAELWGRFFWYLLAQPPSNRKRAVRTIAEMLHHIIFSQE